MCVLVLIATVGIFRYTTHHLIMKLPRWRAKVGSHQRALVITTLENIIARLLRLLLGLFSFQKRPGDNATVNQGGEYQSDAMSPATLELQEIHVDASIC